MDYLYIGGEIREGFENFFYKIIKFLNFDNDEMFCIENNNFYR